MIKSRVGARPGTSAWKSKSASSDEPAEDVAGADEAAVPTDLEPTELDAAGLEADPDALPEALTLTPKS